MLKYLIFIVGISRLQGMTLPDYPKERQLRKELSVMPETIKQSVDELLNLYKKVCDELHARGVDSTLASPIELSEATLLAWGEYPFKKTEDYMVNLEQELIKKKFILACFMRMQSDLNHDLHMLTRDSDGARRIVFDRKQYTPNIAKRVQLIGFEHWGPKRAWDAGT